MAKRDVIEPTSIYHRHPGAYKDHPYYDKHIAFFEVLDIWQGNLIGQKRDHYHNSSKAYLSKAQFAKHILNQLLRR